MIRPGLTEPATHYAECSDVRATFGLALCCMLAGWLVLLSELAQAADPAWLTGPALNKRLADSVDLLWSGQSLRAGLYDLGRAQRVAVLCDRRVDPDKPVHLNASQTPLGSLFKEIARRQDIGVCTLGPVVYFGPTSAVNRLRTLAAIKNDEARKLPAEAMLALLQAKPLHWADLAEPRALLEEMAGQTRLKLQGIERVPHDLWAAADLPALPLTDRLTLVAGQFDLTYSIDPRAGTIALEPMPAEVALVRSYEGGSQGDALAKRFAEIAPEAQIKVSGERVWVKGLLEDHEALSVSGKRADAGGAKTPVKTDAMADKRFSLNVNQEPLGPLLKQVAAQMRIELVLDEAAIRQAGVTLDQRVSFRVKEATADEFFSAALDGTGLTFRLSGKRLEIRPAAKQP